MTEHMTAAEYRAQFAPAECVNFYAPTEHVMSIKFDFPLKGKERPRHGKGRVYTPKKTKAFEDTVRLTAQIAYGARAPLSGPCRVDVWATFPPPKRTAKKCLQGIYGKPYTGKADADNQLKAICDGLNGVAYQDDRQVAHASIERFYGPEHGFRVTITELDG